MFYACVAIKREQNYPNPFSASTGISYKLTKSSHVILRVYDISGREIQTLVNEYQSGGRHTIDWDASHLSEGLYFYELDTDHGPGELRKMIVAR